MYTRKINYNLEPRCCKKILQELAIVFENYISISLVNVPIHWKRKRRDIIYTEGKKKKKILRLETQNVLAWQKKEKKKLCNRQLGIAVI